ncbi:MAG: hypothetical protein HRT73_12535 [Flavobacteriales bacterium]|nr:hypothetical protein [Flavobacteriales bacterium]
MNKRCTVYDFELFMKNIQGSRLVYKRIKIRKIYNIKLTTKAQEIIKHYIKGKKINSKEYIFPIIPKPIDNIEKKGKSTLIKGNILIST